MPNKRSFVVQFNVEVPAALKEALDSIREREGIPFTFQVRRALEEWVAKFDTKPAPRKRGAQ